MWIEERPQSECPDKPCKCCDDHGADPAPCEVWCKECQEWHCSECAIECVEDSRVERW